MPIQNAETSNSKPDYLDKFYPGFRNEGFVVLDDELKEIERHSITSIFRDAGLLKSVYSGDKLNDDPYHINDVHPLVKDNKNTLIFLSLRNQDTLIGYHLESRKPIWFVTGLSTQQHDITPTSLDGSAVSIFDNNSYKISPNKYFEGNRFIELNNLPIDTNKVSIYSGTKLNDQGILSTIDDLEYGLPRPSTITEGRAEYSRNRKYLIIEDTNNGRIIGIDAKNKSIAWEFNNKVTLIFAVYAKLV